MDLRTRYLGMTLRNPIVVASCPLSKTIADLRRLEDAGAGAVVLFSLFEEQIEHETNALGDLLDWTSNRYAEAHSYFPQPASYHRGPDEYLELIRYGRDSLSIPIIGSLNGVSPGGWVDYAHQMEQAGASAIELNVYWIETDPHNNSAEVEQRYIDVVTAIASAVAIPVTVKIGPYFSSLPNFAQRLEEAGAMGVVLFNRFYEPDFDIEKREVSPMLILSGPSEMRLPLHWTAILSSMSGMDIALSTGVRSGRDVLKAMMAGAKVACLASTLLQRGPEAIGEILRDIERWMAEHEQISIHAMQGSMNYRRVANPGAFVRGNYMKELHSYRPEIATLR